MGLIATVAKFFGLTILAPLFLGAVTGAALVAGVTVGSFLLTGAVCALLILGGGFIKVLEAAYSCFCFVLRELANAACRLVAWRPSTPAHWSTARA